MNHDEPYDFTILLLTGERATLRIPGTMTLDTFKHLRTVIDANLDLLEEVFQLTPDADGVVEHIREKP